MAESSTIVLTGNSDGDQIKIDLQVLEVILAIAAGKVDGVAGMRGNFRSGLNWVLGREQRGRGVSVSLDDSKRLTADAYVYFKSGVNVPSVAAELQKALKAQLKQMTDLDLAAVNVHVVGIVFPDEEKQAKQTDEKLFPENSEAKDESARES
jgi:uncharacterized alkaline shock family protein YloU